MQLIDACDELETDTGVKITTDDIGQFQERVGNCFIDKLKNNVTSRFSTSKEIITAFSIFEPKGVPKLGTTELESYGKDSVKTLISHYGESKTATTLDGKDYVKQPIISEEVVFEWKTYRQYMSQKSSTANVGDLLTNETLVSMCPNLHKLANICLCLPVSTASVERSFSQMKLIKSRLRSRLSEISLTQLMKIAIEGPEKLSESDIEQIISVWNRKPRRVSV